MSDLDSKPPEHGYTFTEKGGVAELRVRWANPYYHDQGVTLELCEAPGDDEEPVFTALAYPDVKALRDVLDEFLEADA